MAMQILMQEESLAHVRVWLVRLVSQTLHQTSCCLLTTWKCVPLLNGLLWAG